MELSCLADKLEVDQIWVKDESKRFRLNAFKVLGASYAFARHVSVSAGGMEEPLSFDQILARVRQVRDRECWQ